MIYFKRILSLMLIVLIICSSLVSCGFAKGSHYITTGEFYGLFVEKTGLYYISKTPSDDDIGYDAEVQAMLDWGLLSESDAIDGLYEVVTKEKVVTVCVNNMYFSKKGDVKAFKDAELCDNPQLMADAVATGIVELENGYIDAKEKMTKEDCIKIIETSIKIDSNSHFEDGSGTVEYDYGEDTDVFSADDINPNEIEIYGYTNEQYSFEKSDSTYDEVTPVVNDSQTSDSVLLSSQAESACGINNSVVSNLTNLTNYKIEKNVETLENTEKNSEVIPLAKESDKKEKFTVIIPKKIFEGTMKSPKIGQKVIYMPWQGHFDMQQNMGMNELLKKGFSGKLISFKAMPLHYDCQFEKLDDAEIVEGMKIEKYGKDVKKDNLSHEILSAEVDGFKISFSKINNGYSVNVEKTFKISQNKYNNWRDWKINPKLTCTASITDFHFDCDNIKSIVSKSKKDKTLLSLSYKATQEMKLSAGGLRLAPDSNRNGKFTSNVSKSRFTQGAGAKYIKVGKINIDIPEIGLSVPITLYLEVSVDGTLRILFDQSKKIRLIKQNGNFRFANETIESKTLELTGNIDGALRLEIGLNFMLMRKSLMVVYGKLGVNVTVYTKVYEETKLLNSGYADAEDLQYEHSVQKDMHFCLDVSGYLYGEIGLCEGASYGSFLADILKKAKVDIGKLKLRAQSDSATLCHLEDGLSFTSDIVAKCTIGEDKLEVNTEGEIKLEAYKQNMLNKEQISVGVVSIPIKESKLEKNGGIKIKVKNSKIVTAEYDENLKVINIYAKKEGSTEIELKILKKKKTKKQKAKYYKQEISITVNSEKDSKSSGA